MKKPKGMNQYLRACRIRSGKSQLAAARALGHTTAQYISNLERGLCEPSIEMAFKLCDIYEESRLELATFMVSTYTQQLEKRIKKAMRKH